MILIISYQYTNTQCIIEIISLNWKDRNKRKETKSKQIDSLRINWSYIS